MSRIRVPLPAAYPGVPTPAVGMRHPVFEDAWRWDLPSTDRFHEDTGLHPLEARPPGFDDLSLSLFRIMLTPRPEPEETV